MRFRKLAQRVARPGVDRPGRLDVEPELGQRALRGERQPPLLGALVAQEIGDGVAGLCGAWASATVTGVGDGRGGSGRVGALGAGAATATGRTGAAATGSKDGATRRPCCSATALTTMPIIIAPSAAPAKLRFEVGRSARSQTRAREGAGAALARERAGSLRMRSDASGNPSLLLRRAGEGERRQGQPGYGFEPRGGRAAGDADLGFIGSTAVTRVPTP